MAKRILPMVIHNVDETGIWFKDTIKGEFYIFNWNPIKVLRTIFRGNAYLGFLPFLSKHIKI